MTEFIDDLLHYLNASPTAFHAAANARQRLLTAGFACLSEGDRWSLEAGGKYMVERNGSALVAFRLPTQWSAAAGFRLLTAHTDSPGLKVKLPGSADAANLLMVPVEVYGGAILSAWLDRPLGLAGRAVWATPGGLEVRLFNLDEPLAVIPNLALHLNRDVNQGFAYNPRQHLSACLGKASSADLCRRLDDAVGCPAETSARYELFLYEQTSAQLSGLNRDLLTGPRLDNLTSCHAAIAALIGSPAAVAASVAFLADHEEVGSVSAQGANSAFLRDVLHRVVLALGGDAEDCLRALAGSQLLSMDSAHAVHPSYLDKYDSVATPVIGGGVAIKTNVSQRYCTSALSAERFAAKCRQAGIPCQSFTNRADMPCGSTIGPACAALLGLEGLDVGTPILAMHSIRETAGVQDHLALAAAATAFLAD
ncbi:MAG TPA: M18 family aminopeptidase [Lentisphaeria bacterium]|nr:M18 family aminopeptidase [Lentisphaeria bacterium]